MSALPPLEEMGGPAEGLIMLALYGLIWGLIRLRWWWTERRRH